MKERFRIMEITFEIDDATATFSRDWFTGKAALTLAGQTFSLQDPWNPATHFSLQLTRTWKVDVPNHRVLIEKKRPLLFAGLRANTYRIRVDDRIVAEKSGR